MTGKKTAKEAKPATVFANEPGAEGDAEAHQRLAVRSLEQHPRQPDRPRALAQARQARHEPRPKQRPPLRALRGLSEALREAVAESSLAYELNANSYSYSCLSACLAAEPTSRPATTITRATRPKSHAWGAAMSDIIKRQRLADLLDAFGSNALAPAEFWAGMAEAGLDEQDIDQYCPEEARWIPPSPNDEATTRFRRHPRPHFTCVRCGASVHRPDREWSDSNDVCLNCWFGRPNAE